MTNNNSKSAQIPVGTHLTLTEQYAQKAQLDPALVYRVIAHKTINKAHYLIIEAVDVESPAQFRVHPKYVTVVEAPKMNAKRTSHAECSHASSKSARALCRRQRAAESNYCEGCERTGLKLNSKKYCPDCVTAADKSGHSKAVR